MTYGYIRVSTDKQETDNQRFEIERFCIKQNIKIDEWFDETISGTKELSKRKLGILLEKINKDDLIICTEVSRLGRKLFMIMAVLQNLLDKGAKVWTIKDNYRLGDDIQSKILAFAFGIASEIERDMISSRIKEALVRKKANGAKLGRPFGSKSSHTKLSRYENEIKELVGKKISKSAIGRMYGVNRMTVDNFMKDKGIE
jgi:DNA invertase Pin-like site-specific DNA recombinase